MHPARRAVALCALVALSLLGASCTRRDPPAYAGSWLLKYREMNLMLLTLSVDKEQRVKGTLVRPKHFSVDQEGNFHDIHEPLVERALIGNEIGDSALELAEDDGDHALTFRLIDSYRAEARPQGAPGYTAPWVFERVTGDAPLVVRDWGKEEAESPEIGAVREKLLAMAKEDQAIRQGAISGEEMEAMAARHKPEILRIHEEYGWPKRSRFGVDAADAFWLLVQHQDHKLQKLLLPELEKLAAEGEASRQNYTFLFDRVRRGEGKPQFYGNSAQCKDGRAVLDPVEDLANLNQRRADLHLPPIEEYLSQLEPMCKNLMP